MTNAIAYLRWSTEDQRLSHEVQRTSIETYARSKGLAVVAWHLDEGVSGAADIEKRPGLSAALDAVGEAAPVLLVAKRDRLARDVMVAAMVQRLIERKGGRLESAEGAGNGSEPAEIMLRQILDVFAQFERAMIRMRTSSALRAKKARGGRVGSIPLGRVERNGLLVADGMESDACARAQALRERGLSLREIGAKLTAEGFRPRGKAWHPQTVRAACRRFA